MLTNLKTDMPKFISWCHATAKREGWTIEHDHFNLFHAASAAFELYNREGQAPIWASRIVAGVLSDMNDGLIPD